MKYQIHTPTRYESIITTKEDYLNILNEALELQSMPDIGVPDVILADGEQWRYEVE